MPKAPSLVGRAVQYGGGDGDTSGICKNLLVSEHDVFLF